MMRAAASVGDKMPDRSFLAPNLVFWFGDLAEFESELGNESAAGKAMLEAKRLLDTEFTRTQADFSTVELRQRYPGAQARLLLAANDYPQALEITRSVLREFEALDAPSTGAEQQKRFWLSWTAQGGAIAEYELGNFAAAEKYARSSVENWQALKYSGLRHELFGAQYKTLLAQSIARQGRTAESMEILRPLLAFFREQRSRPHENRMLDFQYAHAL